MKQNTLIVGVLVLVVLALIAYFITSGNSNQSPDTTSSIGTTEPAGSTQKQSERGRYMPYDEGHFVQSSEKRRVLFFYAAWCPTCRPADAEFEANLDDIPEDVVLYRVNYDTEDELKDKYGITYQHTFVQVDEAGNEIAKWNGGGIDELLANIQ